MTKENKKSCFVICPIGQPDSAERKRSDQVLKHIIEPVVTEKGYTPIRADQLDKPGIITNQVIEHLRQDDLVVADLAGGNPNVFYELAVRHVVGKPVILIIQKGDAVPFDVSPSRVIPLDHTDLDSAAECRRRLASQIAAVEEDPLACDNPITQAIDFAPSGDRDTVQKRQTARILDYLQAIQQGVAALQPTPHQTLLADPDLAASLERLKELMERPQVAVLA